MIFDRIYVINLNRRPERWHHTCGEWRRKGLKDQNLTRFEAVDGHDIYRNDPDYFRSILSDSAFREIQEKKRGSHEQMTIGAVGCALSHLSVWKETLRHNLNSVLVLEDDIIIKRGFRYRFFDMWKRVPGDWDMVFLGCWHRKRPIYINEYFVRPVKTFRAHAYVISRDCANILLKTAFPLERQIDAYINQMFRKLNVYVLNPKLVNQKWLKWIDTDVQIPLNRFYDLRPILLKLRKWLKDTDIDFN